MKQNPNYLKPSVAANGPDAIPTPKAIQRNQRSEYDREKVRIRNARRSPVE